MPATGKAVVPSATPPTFRRLGRGIASKLQDLPDRALLVVAVSGGSDSTALLHLVARCPRFIVHVAHVDHQLRPDSNADRDFTARLAERVEAHFHTTQIDVGALARERQKGIEEAARHARYEYFGRLACDLGAHAIVLGHTMDDTAETVMLALLRGTGSAGLAAMPAMRNGLIRRPLLDVRRATLRAYLEALGESFLSDPSNTDRRYRRNVVRLDLLPIMLQQNPRTTESLARTAGLLASEDDYLGRVAADIAEPRDVARLKVLHPAIARRVVLRLLRAALPAAELGHHHVDAVLALTRELKPARAAELPGGRRAYVIDDVLVIRPTTPVPFAPRELTLPGTTLVPERSLAIEIRQASPDVVFRGGGSIVHIDAAALGDTPEIRAITRDDRIQPLGATGHRTLGPYLRDRGVRREERPATTIVVNGNVILWVVGHQVTETARAGRSRSTWEIVARTIPT